MLSCNSLPYTVFRRELVVSPCAFFVLFSRIPWATIAKTAFCCIESLIPTKHGIAGKSVNPVQLHCGAVHTIRPSCVWNPAGAATGLCPTASSHLELVVAAHRQCPFPAGIRFFTPGNRQNPILRELRAGFSRAAEGQAFGRLLHRDGRGRFAVTEGCFVPVLFSWCRAHRRDRFPVLRART